MSECVGETEIPFRVQLLGACTGFYGKRERERERETLTEREGERTRVRVRVSESEMERLGERVSAACSVPWRGR